MCAGSTCFYGIKELNGKLCRMLTSIHILNQQYDGESSRRLIFSTGTLSKQEVYQSTFTAVKLSLF
jgi:hypothetical protein